MTSPEINLSWVILFLDQKRTLKNAENADFCFLSAKISVHLRPN